MEHTQEEKVVAFEMFLVRLREMVEDKSMRATVAEDLAKMMGISISPIQRTLADI